MRGYTTPCCREVVNGLIRGEPHRVSHYAFRAARESDLMLTLLWDTVHMLRGMAHQKQGPDLIAQALAHSQHMRKALKVVETLIDPEGFPPRTFDDYEAKEYPDNPEEWEVR